MYKDRNPRNVSLKKKKICDEMDIDCFNIREVARKTKNIRSAYYRGLKKK